MSRIFLLSPIFANLSYTRILCNKRVTSYKKLNFPKSYLTIAHFYLVRIVSITFTWSLIPDNAIFQTMTYVLFYLKSIMYNSNNFPWSVYNTVNTTSNFLFIQTMHILNLVKPFTIYTYSSNNFPVGRRFFQYDLQIYCYSYNAYWSWSKSVGIYTMFPNINTIAISIKLAYLNIFSVYNAMWLRFIASL